MHNILFDADALVALTKRDDSNHLKAVRIYQELKSKITNFFLSPFTVAEATTVLSNKYSHERAKEFLKEMRSISLPVLELEKESSLPDDWFYKQNKKGTSYFDATTWRFLKNIKNKLMVFLALTEFIKETVSP